MKVCFITPSFPYMNCGVGDYTFELIKSLRDYRLEIKVITSSHHKVRQFQKESHQLGYAVVSGVGTWQFRNLPLIIKEVKDFDPDIIHLQYHCGSTSHGRILKGIMFVSLPLIFKTLGIRSSVITTLHSRLNGPHLFPKAGFLRRWALLPILLFSGRIIATNLYDKRKLLSWLPFLKSKVQYIAGGTGHYFIGDNLKQEAKEIKVQLKKSDNEIIISNFGFMVPYKGIEELLEAISRLRKNGYPLRLLAIGGFDTDFGLAGHYFTQLQDKARELGIAPYIQWTGFCQPKQASLFLLASDICALPFNDGASEWRSSFLDVISHGLPVITTFTERTPPELIDGVNCLFVPPQDAGRLASAIEKLLKQPSLKDSIGEAASQLYRRHYDWSIIAKKTIEVYNKNGASKDEN